MVKIVDGKIQMVEPTIKAMAEDLAGVFYEENRRSDKFRFAFPTVEDYLKGRWHKRAAGSNETIVMRYIPGWQHHVELARKTLVAMLRQPDARVSPAMKERISDALIEDNKNSQKYGKKLAQRRERDGDDKQADEIGRTATGWRGPRANHR